MEKTLYLYNSLARKKVKFEPINPGFVGMYVCGPTVYSDVHLGNVRTFVSFDIIYRHLKYLGYNVRYVRNITDVGHLLDTGEDKMAERAKLEKLEPMEIAQKYSNSFQAMMRIFNTIAPDIEPRATGHIIGQIEMVQSIIDNNLAYEKNGSIYFDTLKYHDKYKNYGQLSGKIIDDLLTETRDDLKNQSEKRHASDFAIWMKASDEHLMKWNSPWSVGFPGWHLECSVMSTKYLGEHFDIHGGGNDLKFPHHENEIAQNIGSCGHAPAKYWLHTNMLLMNGKKMSKSDGNTISPEELFTGNSDHVSQGYHPMIVRFFMLMTHYRSTLDITDEALKAAEKGYKRLMSGIKILDGLSTTNNSNDSEVDKEINQLIEAVKTDMNDDFNTPKALSKLFELVTKINSFNEKHLDINQLKQSTLDMLKEVMNVFVFDIFGLKEDSDSNNNYLDGVMELVIELRQQARSNKDWTTSDLIRDKLNEANITIKDGKEGTTWSL